VFKGVIDSSAFYPNYRPYFYNQTFDLVITLITDWRGYPHLNGKANIFVQEPEPESVSFYPVLPTPSGPDFMPLISKN
jgi:hypothetical protein